MTDNIEILLMVVAVSGGVLGLAAAALYWLDKAVEERVDR
jgi:hypothetical protein